MKVVLNKCYGGFDLSEKAINYLIFLKGRGLTEEEYLDNSFEWRSDKDLIRTVEELGVEANTKFSDLKIEDIGLPKISDYDGIEDVKW